MNSSQSISLGRVHPERFPVLLRCHPEILRHALAVPRLIVVHLVKGFLLQVQGLLHVLHQHTVDLRHARCVDARPMGSLNLQPF